MARVDFTINSPERKPGEPDCTEQPHQYVEHVLTEIEANDFPAPPLDALGKSQASNPIERLKEIQTASENFLAPFAFFVAGVLTLAFIVFFIE